MTIPIAVGVDVKTATAEDEPHVAADGVAVGRYLDADGDGVPDMLPEPDAPAGLVSIPPLARTVIYYALALANGIVGPLAAAGHVDPLIVLVIVNIASVMGFTLAANRVPIAPELGKARR